YAHCGVVRSVLLTLSLFVFHGAGDPPHLHSFPTRRSSDLQRRELDEPFAVGDSFLIAPSVPVPGLPFDVGDICNCRCSVRYSYDIIKVHDDGDTREVPVPELEPGEAALVAASAKWNPE